jgi:hypothetical protein
MRRRKDQAGLSEALAEVERVYRELDARPVERRCTGLGDCCRFRLTGETPYLTRGEALVAARAWKATGRRGLPNRPNGECPMLSEQGRCMIYKGRPMGCRTHFCGPAGGPLPRRDVIDCIRRLESLDASLGGDGPRQIASAVQAALKEMD